MDKLQQFRSLSIVGFSFLVLALSYSTRATFGLIMPFLEEDLGWSRSYTSTIAATALFMTAVLAPLAGRLVDKKGARAVLLLGLGTLALGCFLVALTSNPWAFLIAFGGIAATGFGLVAVHVISTVVEQEFDENQGLMTGIATSGSTAGQLLVIPLIAYLLSSFDWRWAFAGLGVSALLMMGCIRIWFPTGMREKVEQNVDEVSDAGLAADLILIVKLPAFQILFWSYFICGYTTSGVIETHFLPYAYYCGFPPLPSATAYGLLSAINLVGMIMMGWLTDRVNRPLLLGTIYIIRGFTFIILIHVGTNLETLMIFAVIFGLVDYSTTPVTASLVASHIGLRVMGLAFGLISAGHQIGGAVGAYFGGYLFDLYTNYEWVWWSSLWLAIAAGLMVFVLKDGRSKANAAAT